MSQSLAARTLQLIDPAEATKQWDTDSDRIVAQAKDNDVTDKSSCEKMTDLVTFCNAQIKKMEDERKLLVGPLNDHVKMINNRFKESRAPFEDAVNTGRAKITSYIKAEEKRIREEEERLRKEEEDRRLEAAAKAEQEASELRASGNTAEAEVKEQEAMDTLESATNLPAAKKSVPVRGNLGGTASTRKTYKAKLVDIVEAAKHHPELFEFKETLARQMLRGGISLHGITLVEDDSLVIR